MLQRHVVKSCGVLVLVLALLPRAAQAQTCDDQAAPTTNTATAFLKLIALDGRGCLGGEQDKSALARDVRIKLTPAVGSAAPGPDALSEALKVLHARAELLSQSGADPLFTQIASQLTLTRSQLGTRKPPAVPTVWQLNVGSLAVLSTSLEDSVTTACTTPSGACTAAFDRAREILRIAGLTRQVLNLSVADVFIAHLDATTTRLKQWGAYFDTARSQYPWELLINGKVMRDDRKVIDGVKQGFRSVPNYQFIVFHPTIAFEYDNTQPKGEQLNAAAVVDIFGANKWTWKADGSMSTSIGATFIAAIGDKASGSNVSWGAMVHVNHKYSVGFTGRPGGWTLLVSGDIPKVWAKVPQSVRDRLAGGGQ